jgi:hypothetical protein
MTILATASEGWRLIGIGALLLVCCAGPWMLAAWTIRGGRVAAAGGGLALAGAAVACVAFGGAGFLVLVAAAGAVALLARRHLPRGGRIAAGVVIVLAGAPLYFWTLFVIVIGMAAFDCAPDAYECPL